MGMNGWLMVRAFGGGWYSNYIIGSNGYQRAQFWSNGFYHGAIQKNSLMWAFVSAGNQGLPIARFVVYDTLINPVASFKIPGIIVDDIIADTTNHIYVICHDPGPNPHPKVIRFTTPGVPDYAVSIGTFPGYGYECSWELDQRLWIHNGNNQLMALDSSGAVVASFQGVERRFAVYQDHGFSHVKIATDTVKVERYDAQCQLKWATKFLPISNYFGLPYTTEDVHPISVPQSGYTYLVEKLHSNVQPQCGAFTQLDTRQIIDTLGQIRGMTGGNANFRALDLNTSPFGHPVEFGTNSGCIMQTAPEYPYASYSPVHKMLGQCWAYGGPAGTPYVPSVVPSLVTNTATMITPPAILLDTVVLALDSTPYVFLPVCVPPCTEVTATALGGGQVAFDDMTFAYHSIHYDFGDGTTGMVNDPMHIYPSSGNYTVTVIASNDCGTDTATIAVHVCGPGQIGGASMACAGSLSYFHETSGLPNDSLAWLVDGAAAGIGDTLAWSPGTTGTHTISLIHHDAPCLDTSSVTVNVTSGVPQAAFSIAGSGPNQLSFTNLSTNAVLYHWDFGDGQTSTQTSPTHTYASGGNFVICLIASSGCGSDTTCYNYNCPIPYVTLSASSGGAMAYFTTAQLTGASFMNWDFGDGNTATGAVSSHTYSSSGTYSVCLTVGNACASYTTCQSVTVNTSGTASYRTHFPSASSIYEHSIAVQPNGTTLVTETGGGLNRRTFLLDSASGIKWIRKNTDPSFAIAETAPMDNGSFVFVGQQTAAGFSGSEMVWGQIDTTGAVQQTKALNVAGGQSMTHVRKTSNGFLFIGSDQTPGNWYYAKVDQNLQLQWAYAFSKKLVGAFESSNGDNWLIQVPDTGADTVYFVQLSPMGQPVARASVALPYTGASTLQDLVFEVTCDGMVHVVESAIVGGSRRVGILKFDPATQLASSKIYRVDGSTQQNNPVHDVHIAGIQTLHNGHIAAWGDVPTHFNAPLTSAAHKFLVDLDPASFTISCAAFGTPDNTQYMHDAASYGSGRALTASYRSSATQDSLELHRFHDPTDCQLPASTLSILPVLEATNANAASTMGVPGGTSVTSQLPWTLSPYTVSNEHSLMRCAGGCNAGISAAFTYTVQGDTVTLTSGSTPGTTLSWSVSAPTCPPVTSLSMIFPCGVHPVTLIASNGCGSNTVTHPVIVGPQVPVTVSPPSQTICPGTSATFTASTGYASYVWSNGSTSPSISVTAAGTYTVTATDTCGTPFMDTVTLAHIPAATISAGPNQAVCPGTAATFSATPGFSNYQWSNGATTSSIVVTTPGTYAVSATDSCGQQITSSVVLSNLLPPPLNLGVDTGLCSNNSIVLTSLPGMTAYAWSTGATTPDITVSATGIYALTVTGPNGCPSSDTIIVGNSTDCVWPGDANHDGTADNVDILAIGFGFGFSGTTRSGANLNWISQYASDWGIPQTTGVDFKHFDCDGNGIVGHPDTVAVALNYGLTHLKTGGVTTVPPLWIEPEQDTFPAGDTVFFRVHWGDGGNPIANALGVAFELAIDPGCITQGTLYARPYGSFLGVTTQVMTFTHIAAPGDWHMAVTRRDHVGPSGHGGILRVGFLPNVVYPINQNVGFVPIHLLNAVGMNWKGEEIQTATIGDSILISNLVISRPEPSQPELQLMPNPTHDQATLELSLRSPAMVEVMLTDVHGRNVAEIAAEKRIGSGTSNWHIDATRLSVGLYFVQVRVNGAPHTLKLVVSE